VLRFLFTGEEKIKPIAVIMIERAVKELACYDEMQWKE